MNSAKSYQNIADHPLFRTQTQNDVHVDDDIYVNQTLSSTRRPGVPPTPSSTASASCPVTESSGMLLQVAGTPQPAPRKPIPTPRLSRSTSSTAAPTASIDTPDLQPQLRREVSVDAHDVRPIDEDFQPQIVDGCEPNASASRQLVAAVASPLSQRSVVGSALPSTDLGARDENGANRILEFACSKLVEELTASSVVKHEPPVVVARTVDTQTRQPQRGANEQNAVQSEQHNADNNRASAATSSSSLSASATFASTELSPEWKDDSIYENITGFRTDSWLSQISAAQQLLPPTTSSSGASSSKCLPANNRLSSTDDHGARRVPTGPQNITVTSRVSVDQNRSLEAVSQGAVAPVEYELQWLDDDIRWQTYDTKTAKSIETQLAVFPKGNVWLSLGRHRYFLDVDKMMQTNLETGKCRPIRRAHKAPIVEQSGLLAVAAFPASQGLLTRAAGGTPVVYEWQWCDDDNRWQTYDAKTAKSIESRYAANPISDVHILVGRHRYFIDFVTMTQTNVSTCRRRQVRLAVRSTPTSTRHPAESVFPPTRVECKKYQLVEIFDSGSTKDEYRVVADLFTRTMARYPPTAIKRIHNRLLREAFQLYGAQLALKRGTSDVQIRRLFHGTKAKFVNVICEQGFDWRISGSSSGSSYGKGSYFARDAKYSHSYADGSNRMFLVRVIVGDFAVGDRSMVRPPPKDLRDPTGDLYDTCVDNVANPSIFVTFERWQAYPEYLIEY